MIDKVKKKPLQLDLRYEPPHRRKRGKAKLPRIWLEMFKWSPKAGGNVFVHNVNIISLKEAPSLFIGPSKSRYWR